jgi:transcriptional regulator with XRE-family HTH domain
VDDLAASLRAWRDRLSPAEADARRRAPGLRRQEVADLAGLSVGYLTRLEQGRATHPSPLVLSALARALRLTTDEREHLFRLAGHAPPSADRMNRHVTPSVRRLLDRLHDLPVLVYDAAWEIVEMNPLGAALLGEPEDRNIARGHFTGDQSRVVWTEKEGSNFEAGIVSDLRVASARFPADERLASLIEELRRDSPRFAELWDERPAAVHTTARKTLVHPQAGRLTLDCDVLLVHGTDLRIIVYSAPPGSADADALALVGVAALI